MFALPPVKSAGDLPHALAAVVAAVAAGNLTPEEGRAVAAMLEVQRRGIELAITSDGSQHWKLGRGG